MLIWYLEAVIWIWIYVEGNLGLGSSQWTQECDEGSIHFYTTTFICLVKFQRHLILLNSYTNIYFRLSFTFQESALPLTGLSSRMTTLPFRSTLLTLMRTVEPFQTLTLPMLSADLSELRVRLMTAWTDWLSRTISSTTCGHTLVKKSLHVCIR